MTFVVLTFSARASDHFKRWCICQADAVHLQERQLYIILYAELFSIRGSPDFQSILISRSSVQVYHPRVPSPHCSPWSRSLWGNLSRAWLNICSDPKPALKSAISLRPRLRPELLPQAWLKSLGLALLNRRFLLPPLLPFWRGQQRIPEILVSETACKLPVQDCGIIEMMSPQPAQGTGTGGRNNLSIRNHSKRCLSLYGSIFRCLLPRREKMRCRLRLPWAHDKGNFKPGGSEFSRSMTCRFPPSKVSFRIQGFSINLSTASMVAPARKDRFRTVPCVLRSLLTLLPATSWVVLPVTIRHFLWFRSCRHLPLLQGRRARQARLLEASSICAVFINGQFPPAWILIVIMIIYNRVN